MPIFVESDQALPRTSLLQLLFKPCMCLGIPPGRGCHHCMSTHWQKLCKDCGGSGILTAAARQRNSPARTERCGRCSGAGYTPCPQREIPLAKDYIAMLERGEEAAGEAEVVKAVLAAAPKSSQHQRAHVSPVQRRQQKRQQQQKRKPHAQPQPAPTPKNAQPYAHTQAQPTEPSASSVSLTPSAPFALPPEEPAS